MPERRGLLIGIDAYQRIAQLDGCVNDSHLVRSLLVQQFGFPEANLVQLLNEAATRERILAAMDALVDATGTDDIVVFQFAGHGSQMTDREGDEASGLDNTIMPVDSEGWQGDNRDITDDEIHLRLVRLAEKTPYTTLIVDACHSGTITRDAFGEKTRGWPADTRPIDQLPPSPIPPATLLASRGGSPSGWLPLGDQYVLIAGCRDEEVSYEYRPPELQGVTHGALTWFLCRELRNTAPGTTYRDVFERAAAQVNANKATQHPQMEGRIDREVFGIADFEPMRFVPVTQRTRQSVTLGAGAALGMTAGSRWAVHAAGQKHVDGDVLGELEIETVRAATCDARVLAEPVAGAITTGCRAVEIEHNYGDLRMPVEVIGDDSGAVVQMRAGIEANPLLRLADDGVASARVYLLSPRPGGTTAPVPQLGALESATWAAVGDDGLLLGTPRRRDAAAEVVTNLATLARYRQALALDNTDPRSVLRGKVRLELLRRTADGQWVVAEADEGGQVVYEEGDAIAWRVSNGHHEPLHVNLLDFGIGKGIEPLFPARGATDKVAASHTFDLGTRAGDASEYTLWFPEGYPFIPGGDDEVIEGTEVFKVVVSTQPVDMSFLAQEGVRHVESAGRSSPLDTLFRTATGASPTREARKSLPVGGEDWATTCRTITLRRRRA